MSNHTDRMKFEELKCLKTLIHFRIKRQRMLIKKIDAGRWISPVHPKVLHALARMDLKLLDHSIKETSNSMAKLNDIIHSCDLQNDQGK